jgi:hypothetical protein
MVDLRERLRHPDGLVRIGGNGLVEIMVPWCGRGLCAVDVSFVR